jgi:hypothetical protein
LAAGGYRAVAGAAPARRAERTDHVLQLAEQSKACFLLPLRAKGGGGAIFLLADALKEGICDEWVRQVNL